MNVTHTLLASLVALSLTACGGGGSSGGTEAGASSGTDAPLSLTEYTGPWKPNTPVACLTNFPYNTAYTYQVRDVNITAESAGLRIAYAALVFDDATCTTKRGLITETILVSPEKTVLDGRDNVIKATGSALLSSSSGADGGLGLTLNKMPDGTLTELSGKKFLADVKDAKLFLSIAGGATPLDGAGYPIRIDGTKFLVR
ncbi:hypothetical protein [Hydrogenophaga sp.]|uniref:hypothetical protein n=1 Tax=Hydrogenophaga sp. TaxID=1904254 RepID=UPI0027218871|nr:hypothetical protein [Hydrogenophaga sp.]MDO9438488.1 hypothetical protein [Hydrogenophaga sp.]